MYEGMLTLQLFVLIILNYCFKPYIQSAKEGFLTMRLDIHFKHVLDHSQVMLCEDVTKTRPCNIQQYFTAVKTLIFR